jgi:hypothetical protein
MWIVSALLEVAVGLLVPQLSWLLAARLFRKRDREKPWPLAAGMIASGVWVVEWALYLSNTDLLVRGHGAAAGAVMFVVIVGALAQGAFALTLAAALERQRGLAIAGATCSVVVVVFVGVAVWRDSYENDWRREFREDVRANPAVLFVSEGATDADLEQLTSATNLRELRLGAASGVTGPGLRHIPRPDQLEVLNLWNSGITDRHAGELARFKHLRRLNLSSTDIGDVTIERISTLAEIETLDVGFTNITDESVRFLLGMSRLRELNVQGTALSEASVTAIRAKLPGCEVTPP